MKYIIAIILTATLALNAYALSTADEHFYKGANLELNGKDLLAISEYNKAITADTTFLPAYLNLSTIYIKRGMTQQALVVLDNGLRIFKSNPSLVNNYGLLKLLQNDTAGALAVFKRAIDQSPYNAQLYYNFALIYEKLGKIKNAINSYEMAIKLDKRNSKAYNNLASIYIKQQKYKKALALLLQNKYPDIDTYFNLGLIYEKMGKLISAEKNYKKALRITGNDKNVLFRLASVFAARGIYIKAKPLFEKLVEYAPENVSYLTGLADSLKNLGYKSKANAYYRKALKIYQDSILSGSETP